MVTTMDKTKVFTLGLAVAICIGLATRERKLEIFRIVLNTTFSVAICFRSTPTI